MNDKYELTIGIECHVQLATNSKLFSSSNNDARDKEPNLNVNPVDFGLPGMLPVLNREAINLAIRAAKALNSSVAKLSRFDRKHYFYPDLPKGYQTTQMYQPIIEAGYVDVPLDVGDDVRVRIHHAHIEEDAGKLTHYSDYSLVDLNRAGTPLIEIVSEPDIHSSEQARAYASELHKLMTYAGVTRGDLYHGNMRFDVNVSVALKGSSELGTRAEVKNLNSFRSVERAAEYEFKRQVELLEAGQSVVQETRGWNDDKGTTTSQRSKEDAQDYRYMPDPDIPPVVLTDDDIEKIQKLVPMLPGQYRDNWRDLQLDRSVMHAVLSNSSLAETLEAIRIESDNKIVKRVFNWFASAGDFDTSAVESGLVGPQRLSELSQMVGDNKLSSTGAKEVFFALFDEANTGKQPEDIAQAMNLLQNSDEGEIEQIVDAVLADPASSRSIDDIKAGKDKAIGYLVGQVMKQSAGKANPGMAQSLIRKKLDT
ncbi:MAG: Asp-tRNA(Asn)/Glu-tRNA(Gln) amidotransferase subunit GatB [bacterium]|nr:Asp-tRNA(Asn)/Glu-tRNA(Gln) amidotransferase subunit GatB [bacterium]